MEKIYIIYLINLDKCFLEKFSMMKIIFQKNMDLLVFINKNQFPEQLKISIKKLLIIRKLKL